MDIQEMAQKFGAVRYEGETYTLTGQADHSNRVFPGWFGDAREGEKYVAEFSANAMDEEGNRYQVYWQFDFVKGEEPEDLGNLDWDDDHVTRVWTQ